MTKRAVIVTTSIMLSLIAIVTILFSVVFRVRDIEIVSPAEYDATQVLSASRLRKGASIFGLNNDEIANNIEREYPYAKVSVNITGFSRVKITLTNRLPLYYITHGGTYYVLDEQCKVLEITKNSDSAIQYILLNNVFEVTESTYAGEFLTNKYTSVCEYLYKALYSSAMLNLEVGDGEYADRYLEREDMCEVIDSIKFVQVNELKGQVDKLIIATSYGTIISIIEPQQNIELKVNMAFSALRALIERGQGEETRGEISVRYSYDENNNYQPKCEYTLND